MAEKLTQRGIKAIESNGKKQRFPDSNVRGFCLVVTPKGRKSYVIRYRRIDGSQTDMTIGSAENVPLEEARKIARQKFAMTANGTDPLSEKRQAAKRQRESQKRTIAALGSRYRNSPGFKALKPSSQSYYRTHLDKHILPAIGNIAIDNLTRRRIAELLDEIAKERSQSTAKAVHSTLSALLTFAVDRDLVGTNVARQVKAPAPCKPRERVLRPSELQAIWRTTTNGYHLSATVADLLRLCLLLPARIGEIAGMSRDEIDFDKDIWTIPASRMKKPRSHVLPLVGTASGIVKTRAADETGRWLFPNASRTGPINRSSVTRACLRMAKREGWPSFGPHDARRTIATGLARLGYPQHIVERLLSHEAAGQRAIIHYDHYSYHDEKRDALAAWEQELLTVVEEF